MNRTRTVKSQKCFWRKQNLESPLRKMLFMAGSNQDILFTPRHVFSLHFRKHFYPGVRVPPRSDPSLLPSCILSSILLASLRVSKLWPVGQTEPTPVFVNKILLGPWPHPFIKVLPTSICHVDHTATKPKYLLSRTLQKAMSLYSLYSWPMWSSLFFLMNTIWFIFFTLFSLCGMPLKYYTTFRSQFPEVPCLPENSSPMPLPGGPFCCFWNPIIPKISGMCWESMSNWKN